MDDDSLRHLLLFLDANQPPSVPRATSVDDIADGTRLLNALMLLSPGDFEDVALRAETGANWVMLRANLNMVVEACGEFAAKYLSATSAASAVEGVDVSPIARDRDPAAALQLLALVTTVCMLGGGQEAVSRVKALEKPTQAEVSKVVKQFASEHGLKKRKGDLVPRKATSSSPTPGATQSPAAPTPTYGASAQLDAEITALTLQKNELQDNLAATIESRKKVEDRLKARDVEYDRLHEQYQQLLKSLAESETVAVRNLENAVKAKDAELANLRRELTAVKETHGRELEAAKREAATAAERAKTAEAQVAELQVDHDRTLTELRYAKDMTAAQARSKGNLEDHVSDVAKERDDAQRAAASAATDREKAVAALAETNERLRVALGRISDLELRNEMLEKHSATPTAAAASAIDESPPPRATASIDALTRDLQEVRRQLEAKSEELEKTKKHLAAATKQASSQKSSASSSDLEAAQREITRLQQENVDSHDKHRKCLAAVNSMMFKQAHRIVALQTELHRHTKRIPDAILRADRAPRKGEPASTGALTLFEESEEAPMSFLQRTRYQLESGPLLSCE